MLPKELRPIYERLNLASGLQIELKDGQVGGTTISGRHVTKGCRILPKSLWESCPMGPGGRQNDLVDRWDFVPPISIF